MQVFDRTMHTALWTWLSDRPGAERGDFDYSLYYMRNGCYACDATEHIERDQNYCVACPLEWPSQAMWYQCYGKDGLCARVWAIEKSMGSYISNCFPPPRTFMSQYKELCLQIGNLPLSKYAIDAQRKGILEIV